MTIYKLKFNNNNKIILDYWNSSHVFGDFNPISQLRLEIYYGYK